ncbi:MAG: bis(5'-nucleosyl)-tetraphosphatase (symmetrical) YqeK [Oscillospiraceae bacterium]|nr:bis(5'-nucleosyl)-tetraphosphatase (symmetrical) YqeK [Oscillospiraceae bacterium]
MLGDKRFEHSINVAEEARKLARHYGNASPETAYLTGLLHDICKELPKGELLEMVKKSGPDICPAELEIPQLYHAPAGAWYIRERLGIKDEDLLCAVRFHTTGRGGMSALEEITYLADLISADRDYPDLKHMRKLAYKNINKAMLYAFSYCITETVEERSLIPENTVNAYNYYLLKSGKELKA